MSQNLALVSACSKECVVVSKQVFCLLQAGFFLGQTDRRETRHWTLDCFSQRHPLICSSTELLSMGFWPVARVLGAWTSVLFTCLFLQLWSTLV